MDLNNNYFWEFPIQIGMDIVEGVMFPKFYENDGLAKVGYEGEIAKFGGWNEKQAGKLLQIIPSKLEFSVDTNKIYILKNSLIMN